MLNLYVIQARYGDCFLLEYNSKTKPKYILIDGGPNQNYENNLKPSLLKFLKKSKTLESIIISHVDNDHILGVLDFLVDIKFQRDSKDTNNLSIGELWFNSFSDTIETGDFEKRIKKVNAFAGANGMKMSEMRIAINGVKQGHQVATYARMLQIPINPKVKNKAYFAQSIGQDISKPNLEIIVVGPTLKNIQRLQKTWEKWIEKNEKKIEEGKYTQKFAAMQDRSIPNLSSLVLLFKANGKSILFTGDCRGDHLQEGLKETGLSKDGKFHVDILKVPHHGSKRNVTRKFFKEVTGDTYIISADGKHGNPDYETLQWIVETSKEAGRTIELIFTNQTPSTKKLLKNYDDKKWNYSVRFLKPSDKAMLV